MHFKFLGWHVCILYIAYHEYSMIDPSGTLITGTCLLCGSVTGWDLAGVRFWSFASFVSV